MAEKVFDLDAIARPVAGKVRFGGAVYDVRQLTGGEHRALRAMTAETSVETTYRVAALVLVGATDEIVESLTVDQANAVIGIAGAGVAAVEAMFPNSSGSAASETSSPDSGPSI